MFRFGLLEKLEKFPFSLCNYILGMYFQNGPYSSEEDPQVSLYEAALTTD